MNHLSYPLLYILALNSMVQISDRPVTRQGLGGIKTQGQGRWNTLNYFLNYFMLFVFFLSF